MFFAVWTQWRYAVVLDLDFVQQIVLCFHRSSKLGHSGAAACFMKNDAGKLNFAEITAIGIGGMIAAAYSPSSVSRSQSPVTPWC
jgi:hypothetical protein